MDSKEIKTGENLPMVTDLDDPVDNERVDSSKKHSDVSLDKLSVDQLIVKSPKDNLSVSAKSSVKEVKCVEKSVVFDGDVFWLGTFQVFFGILMMGFAVYAIFHEASMSMISSGIWTGLIAISTGIFGILATATRCCPVEDRWRKQSQTLFLGLSLISLALSQLVVVLSGIGLARDLNNTENEKENPGVENQPNEITIDSKFSIIIPENYYGILANVALIVVSALECICALISSYKGAKAICPCFKKEKILYTGLPVNNSHALVSSWLGKHTPPPQLYVVTSSSTLGKGTKLSGGLSVGPMFNYPPQMMTPHLVGVPLIPAPLGTIPSPIIPPNRKHAQHLYSKHISKSKLTSHRPMEKTPRPSRSRFRSRSQSREEPLTEKDVAKTYTGLDKEIAERFIERCENKKNNNSLSSKTSCDNSSSFSGPTTSTSRSGEESTTNSKDFLVK